MLRAVLLSAVSKWIESRVLRRGQQAAAAVFQRFGSAHERPRHRQAQPAFPSPVPFLSLANGWRPGKSEILPTGRENRNIRKNAASKSSRLVRRRIQHFVGPALARRGPPRQPRTAEKKAVR